MIKPEDILSLEYLKKTEYTGSHQGMRYRLEKKRMTGKRSCMSVYGRSPLIFQDSGGAEAACSI